MVTTGAGCIADFSGGITLPVTTPSGHVVTTTATDPDGNTSEFSHYVAVTSLNQPPVAVNDNYSVNQGAALNVAAPGVLANDTDADPGTILTAVLGIGPINGTLALNSDGSFTYTPNLGFTGPDSFTYRANDGSPTAIPLL